MNGDELDRHLATRPPVRYTHGPRFAVQAQFQNGTMGLTVREGGSSMDAAIEAMERGGIGTTVRVQPLDPQGGAK